MLLTDLSDWLRAMIYLRLFSTFYAFSSYTFIICLTFMAAIMLRVLSQRITGNDIREIDQWRLCYWLITGLIDKINHCFGFVLLILITSAFIRMINNSFFIISAFRNQEGNDIVVLFFRFWSVLHEFVFILVTALGSRQVEIEVRSEGLLNIISLHNLDFKTVKSRQRIWQRGFVD